LIIAPLAKATIWRVAQDGSGDFDNPHSVASAVAEGDTFFIAADDSTTLATVIYEPFAFESVSLRKSSAGSMKALYSDPR